MRCRFELTYLYDLLTYLKTVGAKVVMFGIKLIVMKCRFELTYFHDLLTYLKTVGAKVVMFGIKLIVMCRHLLGSFTCCLKIRSRSQRSNSKISLIVKVAHQSVCI